MKTDHPLSALAVTVLLALCLAVPFLSWLLWSVGMDVRPLYSDEGLRWTFRRLPGLTFGPALQACLLTAGALAVWRRVWLHRHTAHASASAVAATCGLALLMGGLLTAAACSVHSPLLSITGTLWGSPLLHGLPMVLPCLAVVLGLFHALMTRMVHTPAQLAGLLCAVFADMPALPVCLLLASCCWQCLAYMLSL